MRKIFITGIGTNVGKTIVAAILVEALEADYWKPVQAGNHYPTDSELIRLLISNKKSIIHPEAYCFKNPLSPHAAASLEGKTILPEEIITPATKNKILVIEGAGGLMVPLNETFLMLDLIKQLKAALIIVVENYLGSINHSLLTIAAAKENNITIAGIVFNGASNLESEKIILNYTKLQCLGNIKKAEKIDKAFIITQAQQFKNI